MRRQLMVLMLMTGFASVATAGPLPWTYTATITPTGSNNEVLLGQEIVGYQTVYSTLIFPSAVSESLAMSSYQEPFSFSLSDVTTTTAMPTGPLTTQQFNYSMQLQNQFGDTGTVSMLGYISASAVKTSGTGNFTIGFDGTQDVMVGAQMARVTFGTRESESVNRLTFDVEVLPPSINTPEPGTLVLAGAACFAWVVSRKRRRATLGSPS